MPYMTNEDLPEAVRVNLPAHAQDIFREAFNHAWSEYVMPIKRRLGGTHDQVAYRVAWAAVKRKYIKTGDMWVARPVRHKVKSEPVAQRV